MAATPNLPAAPNLGLVQIVQADASGQKTILTAGSNGSKVSSVFVLSDDTNARLITLSVLRSGTNYPIAVVSVPAGSGTDGAAAAVNLLGAALSPWVPVDNDGQNYLLLKNGDSLQVKSGSTVSSTKALTIGAIGADF